MSRYDFNFEKLKEVGKITSNEDRVKIVNENIQKYIIIKLEDAKYIANYLPEGPIRSRFEEETGANIEEIAHLLKTMEFCEACVIECREHTCESLFARKLGRRLKRLIDRAQTTEENKNE